MYIKSKAMHGLILFVKNKKALLIIGSVFLLVIAVTLYLLVGKSNIQAPEQGSQLPPVAPETVDVVSKIEELTNPVGNKLPDLNPIEKTNPFKDIYKNPFQ